MKKKKTEKKKRDRLYWFESADLGLLFKPNRGGGEEEEMTWHSFSQIFFSAIHINTFQNDVCSRFSQSHPHGSVFLPIVELYSGLHTGCPMNDKIGKRPAVYFIGTGHNGSQSKLPFLENLISYFAGYLQILSLTMNIFTPPPTPTHNQKIVIFHLQSLITNQFCHWQCTNSIPPPLPNKKKIVIFNWCSLWYISFR